MAIDHTTQPANFLSLPLEIRLQIYDLLLILPSSSTPFRPGYISQTTPQDLVHPAILLANRLINHEATPVLYTRNTFTAHSSMLASFPRLRPWNAPIVSPAVLPLIRRFHLQIRLDVDLPFEPEAAADAFTGMDELRVQVVQAVFLGCGMANLKCLEAIRGVKKVEVRGSTTGFGDYIEWLEEAMRTEPGGEVVEFKPSEPGRAQRLIELEAC